MPKSVKGENMNRYYLVKYVLDDQYKIFDSEKIDGLYESFKVNEKTIEVSWENKWNGMYHHKTYDIVKQAEKIEELCDVFVRVSKSNHDFLVSNDMPTKKFSDDEIYGAIWTDKGLIYVAKMNDKGELELL